jgi:hypothetical protein
VIVRAEPRKALSCQGYPWLYGIGLILAVAWASGCGADHGSTRDSTTGTRDSRRDDAGVALDRGADAAEPEADSGFPTRDAAGRKDAVADGGIDLGRPDQRDSGPHGERDSGSSRDAAHDAPSTVDQGLPDATPIPDANADSAWPDRPPPQQVEAIRGTTFALHGHGIIETHRVLIDELDRIAALGLDTVWLVLPWKHFQPRPIAEPDSYVETRFDSLRRVLGALRARGMRAILPLNYFGPGWSPEGIDCNMLLEHRQGENAQWDALLAYIVGFLRRIVAYNDVAYVLLFAEGMHPCGWDYRTRGVEIARMMQSTFGRLPSQLPATLRERFTIGFHDWGYVPRGWSGLGSKQVLPLARPLQYDFVSATLYGHERVSDPDLRAELERRFDRLAAAYPGAPHLLGEFGANACLSGTTATQARTIRSTVEVALQRHVGVNVWGMHQLGDLTCNGKGDLRIVDDDGKWRPAAQAYRAQITTPLISGATAGVNTRFAPWAVWVRASGLEAGTAAELYDRDGMVWASKLPTTLAADGKGLTFRLPANEPPSRCNAQTSCDISFTLALPRGQQSRRIELRLPAH